MVVHARSGVVFLQAVGTRPRLSRLESEMLCCVRALLDDQLGKLWDRQVRAINKVQRLAEGVEVDFYRMENGRPSCRRELALPNKREVAVATVKVEMNDIGELEAKVWCVKGFIFSIEYEGSANRFEAATGMDPRPNSTITCELVADLAAA